MKKCNISCEPKHRLESFSGQNIDEKDSSSVSPLKVLTTWIKANRQILITVMDFLRALNEVDHHKLLLKLQN
jgi:hypothetical protein